MRIIICFQRVAERLENKEVHNRSNVTISWKQRDNLAISKAWQISIENKWA